MTIILAALGEDAQVSCIGSGVEHAGLLAVAGDALPLQVSNMLDQRRRAKSSCLMPDHAPLHHHPARRRAQRQRQRCGAASAETGTATSLCPTKAPAGVTGFPGGPHDLADEALRPCRSASLVANTAGANSQIILATRHCSLRRFGMSDGSRSIEFVRISEKAPAGDFVRGSRSPTPPTISARRQAVLLSCNPWPDSPRARGLASKYAISHDRVR